MPGLRLMQRLVLALAALVALAAAPAYAHTRSETHSSWRINGDTVSLSFAVPDLEAKRLAAYQHQRMCHAAVGCFRRLAQLRIGRIGLHGLCPRSYDLINGQRPQRQFAAARLDRCEHPRRHVADEQEQRA